MAVATAIRSVLPLAPDRAGGTVFRTDEKGGVVTDRAQSEVVGSVLMTAVAVLTVATFGFYALGSGPGSADVPRTNVDATVTNGNVGFTHHGGDSLETDEPRMSLSVNGTERRLRWSDGTLAGSDPSRFEPGETWKNETRLRGDAEVELWLIHDRSNAVVVHLARSPTADRGVARAQPPR